MTFAGHGEVSAQLDSESDPRRLSWANATKWDKIKEPPSDAQKAVPVAAPEKKQAPPPPVSREEALTERQQKVHGALVAKGCSAEAASRVVRQRQAAIAAAHTGKPLKPVDASKYIVNTTTAATKANLDVNQISAEEIYKHALEHNKAQYQDELTLGMRGQRHAVSGISSGMRVQLIADPSKKGKTSICVTSGGHGRFLVYWDDGEQGYANGDEVESEGLPNDGWTDDNIEALTAQIAEVTRRGGVRACLSDDEKMLEFMDAVWENYQASLGVYDDCLEAVRADPSFGALRELSNELTPSEYRAQKPRQAGCASGEALYVQAARAKPAFDALLASVAGRTGATAVPAPIKKVFRACEKVHVEYKGQGGGSGWALLTDVVRGTLVAESLEGVRACVLAVRDEPGVRVLRCKNKFCDADEGLGYRDFAMLVVLGGSEHICEVQLHLQAYVDVKKAGAHKVYAQARGMALC